MNSFDFIFLLHHEKCPEHFTFDKQNLNHLFNSDKQNRVCLFSYFFFYFSFCLNLMEAHIAGVDVIFVWNQARTLVDTHTDTACLCVWNRNGNGNEDKISKLNVREIELRVHFRVNSDTIFFFLHSFAFRYINQKKIEKANIFCC